MSEKADSTKRKFSKTLAAEREKFVAFMNRVVRDIIVLNEENVEDMPSGRMMVCCTHRSHLDYVILGMKIPEFGAEQIRFAAGDNLTRIPRLGKLFRSVGAFSVYRGKASQRAYLVRLAEQVKMMVASGDSIIVFPEAGRSYSGKMLEAKSGILAAGVLAQKDEPKKDIYYLPCAINYTKLPDLRAFDLLLKGKNMRDTSKNIIGKIFGAFLYYFADIRVFVGSWIFKNRTDVILNVAKAVPLSEITDVEGKYREEAKSPLVANRDSINEATAWVEKRLTEIFPILPMNLVAFLFENYGRSGLTEENVAKYVEKLEESGFCVDVFSDCTSKEILRAGIKQLNENGALRGIFHTSVKHKKRLKYLAAFVKSALANEK